MYHTGAPQPDGYTEVVTPADIGNNGILFQPIHIHEVTKLVVKFPGSGAVNEILYRVCPYTRSPSRAPSNEPTVNSMPINIDEALDCDNDGTFIPGSLTPVTGIQIDGVPNPPGSNPLEWADATLFDMYQDGNPAMPLLSQALVQVDCATNQWYVWVYLVDDATNSIDIAVPADHFVSVDGNIIITGLANGVVATDTWAWVQPASTTTGWEASAVAPSSPDSVVIQTMVQTPGGLVESIVDLGICVCGNSFPSARTFCFVLFACCC